MLTLEKIRQHCGSLKGTAEDFPFDFSTLVFKVGGKIYGLTSIDADEIWINLKCDPFLAVDLRQKYAAVSPGYHMSKKHWNTVVVDGSIPEKEIFDMIDHSYDLVFKKLKKSVKEEILLATSEK